MCRLVVRICRQCVMTEERLPPWRLQLPPKTVSFDYEFPKVVILQLCSLSFSVTAARDLYLPPTNHARNQLYYQLCSEVICFSQAVI